MTETFPKDDNYCTCRRQTTTERPNIYSVYVTASFLGARVDCESFLELSPVKIIAHIAQLIVGSLSLPLCSSGAVSTLCFVWKFSVYQIEAQIIISFHFFLKEE